MSDEINNSFKTYTNDIVNIANDIGSLFMQEELSDLTLIVNDQRFPVHKVILAARCQYFRALLYGGLKESYENEIVLQEDASERAVEHVLKFIYKGTANLTELNEDLVLDMLSLAHKYGLSSLERHISNHLATNLCIDNVVTVFNVAVLYEIRSLCDTCLRFLDKRCDDFIDSNLLSLLSESALVRLIERDSFCVPETAIFEAVRKWINANEISALEGIKERVLGAVRLQLMSLEALLGVVRQSQLVPAEKLLDAIAASHLDRGVTPPHRGLVLPEEDLAMPQWRFSIIQGARCGSSSSNSSNSPNSFVADDSGGNVIAEHIVGYDEDDLVGSSSNNANLVSSIVFQLGTPSKLNKVVLQLAGGRETRSSSYTLEGSLDQISWTMLVDFRRFCCRSWQTLYFEPQVLRYLRLTGTPLPCSSSSNGGGVCGSGQARSVFSILKIHCMYTEHAPPLLTSSNSNNGGNNGDLSVSGPIAPGLVMPEYNVCLMDHHATVVDGVSRTRNSLLNGDYNTYNWDSGYTCHQLGNGAIVVQLAQPYWLSHIRMLLWDLDDRVYSYTLEVSCDRIHWAVVADRSALQCSSWQSLTFAPRPVVFIRIIGTHNSANEVFHVVHIEANYLPPPASPVAHKLQFSISCPTSSTATELESIDLTNQTETIQQQQQQQQLDFEEEVASSSSAVITTTISPDAIVNTATSSTVTSSTTTRGRAHLESQLQNLDLINDTVETD